MKQYPKIKLITREAEFVWGEIALIHRIGDITIVEANDPRFDPEDGARFHVYVGDVSTNYGVHSLDAAMILALAYKYDGPNSQAAHYFAKMIGLP